MPRLKGLHKGEVQERRAERVSAEIVTEGIIGGREAASRTKTVRGFSERVVTCGSAT
jgi:hypothetical protein